MIVGLLNTVIPLYSELFYSEYPLIVNGFLRTDCQFMVKLNTFIVNAPVLVNDFYRPVHYKQE